jgi:hypothetical protein
MNKQIAIFFTGEPRTIYKTIVYLKKNIIKKKENFHIFTILQKTNHNEHLEDLEDFFKNIFQNNLKSFLWFDKNEENWNNKQNELISKINNISQNWKNYLKNSGSMIEYYQMYLAYQSMKDYEEKNNIYYDYIFRIRSDNIITNPILFDWIDFDILKIKEYFYKIKEYYQFNSIINYEVICLFMNSIYFPERFKVIKDRNNYNFTKDKEYMLTNDLKNLLKHTKEDEFLNDFYSYFKKEKYCFIFRTNNIYFMNRKYFDNISILALRYGEYPMYNNEDTYWFNSESQFIKCLNHNHIDIFDSFTQIEEKSIYEYNNSNYFNHFNELITNDPNLLFFICRH